MMLELSDDVAEELRDTLEQVISDMSSEIADTDNARFRAGLLERRARLQQALGQLSPTEPATSA